MAPTRRRATPRASEGSPSTGEPTKATFEPISRIPDAVQDIDASQWPPLDQADPAAFLDQARAVVEAFAERMALGLTGANTDAASIAAILTQAGRDAAIVVASECQFRWPEISEAEIREDLFRAYDERLVELARDVSWAGGVA
jgi:hypothetical protein